MSLIEESNKVRRFLDLLSGEFRCPDCQREGFAGREFTAPWCGVVYCPVCLCPAEFRSALLERRARQHLLVQE